MSLTQDAARELLYPIMPTCSSPACSGRRPPVVGGLVEGSAEAVPAVSKYVAGRWSDTRARRPFVTAGYGLAAVGKVLVAAAVGWPMVLVGRVVDRLGKGVPVGAARRAASQPPCRVRTTAARSASTARATRSAR